LRHRLKFARTDLAHFGQRLRFEEVLKLILVFTIIDFGHSISALADISTSGRLIKIISGTLLRESKLWKDFNKQYSTGNYRHTFQF